MFRYFLPTSSFRFLPDYILRLRYCLFLLQRIIPTPRPPPHPGIGSQSIFHRKVFVSINPYLWHPPQDVFYPPPANVWTIREHQSSSSLELPQVLMPSPAWFGPTSHERRIRLQFGYFWIRCVFLFGTGSRLFLTISNLSSWQLPYWAFPMYINFCKARSSALQDAKFHHQLTQSLQYRKLFNPPSYKLGDDVWVNYIYSKDSFSSYQSSNKLVIHRFIPIRITKLIASNAV